jgi:hypothetical protein
MDIRLISISMDLLLHLDFIFFQICGKENYSQLFLYFVFFLFHATNFHIETKCPEVDPVVSLQPLSTLSASSLQLLHERTMINTDLDLDSLDESASSNPCHLHLESASITSSQTGLLHPLVPRYNDL